MILQKARRPDGWRVKLFRKGQQKTLVVEGFLSL